MIEPGADLGLIFVTGTLLGTRHALDPDHLLAVSALVTREHTVRASARIATLWGAGHSVTIALAGSAILGLRGTFSPRITLAFELAVAAMLLLLGAANLLAVERTEGTLANARPLAVGAMHGLAGSAALALVLLPLIPDPIAAALFLLVFGVGTLLGMAATTVAFAAPAMLAARRVAGVQRGLRLATGMTSVVGGAWLVYRVMAALHGTSGTIGRSPDAGPG